MTEPPHPDDIEFSYDKVAEEYARRLFDELDAKPFDRNLLDEFSLSVRPGGLVCDLGCGPGQIARYLRLRGLTVCGVDISNGMVEIARGLNPGIEFHQGNMTSLKFADETFAGIAAFYSIIHLPRGGVVDALFELKRVLEPGGLLLLAFHVGDEIVHRDELFGEKISLDFAFFLTDEVTGYLKAAGFDVVSANERDPYPEAEYPSRRAYIVSSKPTVVA